MSIALLLLKNKYNNVDRSEITNLRKSTTIKIQQEHDLEITSINTIHEEKIKNSNEIISLLKQTHQENLDLQKNKYDEIIAQKE